MQTQVHKTSYHPDSCEFCPLHKNVLVVGSYQLDHTETRVGKIILFHVREPNSNDSEHSSLQEVQQIDTSGIFDIKWCPRTLSDQTILGLACADGTINVLALQDEATRLNSLATTSPLSNTNPNVSGISMCLSLDWDNKKEDKDTPQIAVSHSSGALSLWKCNLDKIDLVSEWQAHEYEAWTVSFNDWQPTTIFSGADDCCLKGWDTRQSLSHSLFSKRHDMGITCIQFAPNRENLVAVGCYDESIKLWDTRAMKAPLSCTYTHGGGVWRVKWAEYDQKTFLCAACMHAGFQLWEVTDNDSLNQISTYTAPHTSLAYGIDWLNTTKPLIACCSFYDNLLSLWEPNLFVQIPNCK